MLLNSKTIYPYKRKNEEKETERGSLKDGAASDRVFAPTVQDKNGLAAVAISVSGRAAAGAVFFAIAKLSVAVRMGEEMPAFNLL